MDYSNKQFDVFLLDDVMDAKNKEESKPAPVPSPPPLFSMKSQRLRIVLMMMFGLYAIVSMRVNLGMAIVCMVNTTAFPRSIPANFTQLQESNEENPRCERRAEEMASHGYNGTLLWSPQMQSILLSATFYGSLATVSISGALADKFGPKLILGGTCFVYILVTMATPFLAHTSYLAYFVARVIMGLGEGFLFPSLGSMAGRWFPPNERSTMSAIYTSGNQLAASLSSVISAGLCGSSFGWPAIFYLFGTLGVIWLVGWCVAASNYPDENAFISDRERSYLKEVIPVKKKNEKAFPWRAILRSAPIHACICAQFSFNITTTIMQGFLPMYFRDELLLSLSQNGIYTTVPFIFQLVTKLILSFIADKLKQKNILTPTECAVFFQTLCAVGATVSTLCLALLPSCERPWLAAIFLALLGASVSANVPGFFTALLSIAPQHSGMMTSIARTSASIANVVAPMWFTLVTILKPDYTWPIIFVTIAILNTISGVVFYFYGDAEIQEWALAPDQSNKMQSITPRSIIVQPVEIALDDKQR
ncbi:hypothetical protein PFISCL1PPCAC_23265 [Pristionchus fissidentatus]|uniref:Major facilitator superfamily (MFS) profile domain-containing protein n=1 Tax=Pristionchus fissidentatus TaxID=1538716 RepID=A0AAV5WKK8_9BILA|nr:hypothetical protein PFISCL1PPCAC_23265 [Pristionchus fissidentatus]